MRGWGWGGEIPELPLKYNFILKDNSSSSIGYTELAHHGLVGQWGTAGVRKAEEGSHDAKGLMWFPYTLVFHQYLQDTVTCLCQLRGFMIYCIILF